MMENKLLLNPVKPPKWPAEETPMSEAKGITLAELAAAGRQLIAECVDCGHNRKLEPAKLKVAPDTAVADVGKRMRCSCCDGRRILTRGEPVREGQ